MNIIGREKNLEKLNNLLQSTEAQLVAVYGRRRVGKTYMINRFFQDKGLYFEITGKFGGQTKEQLRHFTRTFNETFYKNIAVPKNWDEALNLLRKELQEVPSNRKIILFFDELPWMATPRSDLLRSIEHTWNRYFSRQSNIIMILCGSAASWMIKKIIQNKGGLYGRLTESICLEPFTLAETEEYLQAKDIHLARKQIIEIYLATGGVAKYLNHIPRGKSAAQIIQSLCFSTGGFLQTEFVRLFSSLFHSYERHIAIIRALSKVHQGLTIKELEKETGLSSGGRFSEIIQELELSGFIQFIPFYGRKKREGHYRLIDEYSLFYLTWIESALIGKKHPISPNYWLNQHSSQRYLSWAGYAFENLCIKHLSQIIAAMDLTVVAKNISYWAYKPNKNEEIKGAQIDLIIERFDKCINLCEIKFYDSSFATKNEYADRINYKRALFREKTKTTNSLFNTLITPHAATTSAAYLSCFDNQVNQDALFVK